MSLRRHHVMVALLGSAILQSPVHAQYQMIASVCENNRCTARVTAAELLATAEKLVAEHRFAEAAPMIAALENAPQFAMQRNFLAGYVAVESGDLDLAIGNFRTILEGQPNQTRVRLELARALMLKGKGGAADHHFRVAQQDPDLPPEISATIRSSRGLLRDKRRWGFNVDLGIAPDSNITNATNAEVIDIAFGNQIVPLALDSSARAQSGTGQNLGLSGTARIPVLESAKLLIEADTQLINYGGKAHDDYSGQIAIGPEFTLSDSLQVAVQAFGTQRWFGGTKVNSATGARTSLQHALSDRQKIGFSIDARRTESGIADIYNGWQFGGYATYERAFSRTLLASASLFARRDALNARAYSGHEIGANIGIGGELPLGLTAGVSGGVSRGSYDEALPLFGRDPRSDLRMNGRLHIGLRSMRMLGFSPSVTYSYAKIQSTISLFDSDRHRLRFGFARYF